MALSIVSGMGVFCTALVAQCEMMEGFEPEAPKSTKGKAIWITVAIMGHVPGRHEHCVKAWKERPSVRRKFYWAASWLLALFVFVGLKILADIHRW